MSPRSEQLRSRLRDAVVALCQDQAFYLKQLRIEGTLCVVSDQSSVLITQISEQIGDMVKQENTDGAEHLPQLDPEQRGGLSGSHHFQGNAAQKELMQQHHGGEKRRHEEDNEDVPSEHAGKRMYPDTSIDSHDDSQRYVPQTLDSTPTSHQDGKSSSLEQATLSYQTFNESETSTISQLEEAIQDFPEITKINGKFQCPLCEKSYAFKHSAKAHLSTHNKNMKYACKLCPAKFSYASSLNGHTKKHHPDSMSKEYVCELCQQICFNLPSLKQHYTWRHKDMKVPGVLYEAPVITTTEADTRTAPAVFPGQQSSGGGGGGDDTLDILQQVIQRYSSEAQCVVPPASLQSYNQQVLQHHNVHGLGHNVPMATEAVSNMMSAAIPRLHQEQYSPQNRTTMSTVGPSSSNSSPMLLPTPTLPPPPSSPKEKLHIADHFDEVNIQTEHGLYKYQCKTCSNMFKSRHALYEHVNTHLGRKPFSCDICGLTFAHHSTLYNHKRNKHTFSSKAEKEALFKFRCPQCDKRFEFPSALDRHFAKYPEHSIKREFTSPPSSGEVLHNSGQELLQQYQNEPLPPIQSVAQSIALSLSSSEPLVSSAVAAGQNNTYVPELTTTSSTLSMSLAPGTSTIPGSSTIVSAVLPSSAEAGSVYSGPS